MSNRNEQREKLLAELFHPEWTEGVASNFARAAAAHARRRRRLHRSLVATGAAAALILAAAFLRVGQREQVSAVTGAPTNHRAYEIITDEALLAQLSDRPLLVLPQQDGTKTIVLLNR